MSHIQDAVATTEAVNEILSIVVFGSVVRGQADRQNDINLFVVDGDQTSARRVVTDVVADLREQRFNGDRFDFEPYVESSESAHRAGSKLREIFTEGEFRLLERGTMQPNDLSGIHPGVYREMAATGLTESVAENLTDL